METTEQSHQVPLTQKREAILTAKNLTKEFHSPKPIRIIDNLSLQIYPGESVAITGRSGEGKSTLLNILGLLDTPCKGTVQFNEADTLLYSKDQIRNCSIGFIFQSFHLLEHLSTLQNILIPAKIARKSTKPGSESYLRALELIKQVELEGRESFSTKLLSGGEKQRVAIARALCNDPAIILADEPTGNLDAETSKKIEDLLFSLCKKSNKTLIIVTHDKTIAEKCTRELILKNGKLFEPKNN